MPTITMRAPTALAASQVVGAPSGLTYTPTANGFAPVDVRDVATFLAMGWTPFARRDNMSATTDPTVTDDSTVDYAVGSAWVNTTYGGRWTCVSAAAGAAKWVCTEAHLIGRLINANMNVTTDQAIPLFTGGASFRPSKITVKNATISLTTAAGGIYPSASKAGTAIVANSQAYSALTGSTLALDLTIATVPGTTVYAATSTWFFSLTTAQGAAATADLYLYGDRYVSG